MRLCIFEDAGVSNLEPLTLTRPAFALRCGAETILERQRRALGAHEVGAWVRLPWFELTRLGHPDLIVNDAAWSSAARVWSNARWLPSLTGSVDSTTPHVGLLGQQIAYVVPPLGDAPEDWTSLDHWLQHSKESLPSTEASGLMLDYLWDAVDANAETLCQDWQWFRRLPCQPLPPSLAVLGPAERVVIARDAVVEPFVVADTRQGPVMIAQGAVVHSFSRLEGPCYIGPETWILGARIRGGTIGPRCRIGGEFEVNIVQGHANKYHDGFLGHSYLGEWVNLAAGTQTSDLRNDYGAIRVYVDGQRVGSGRTKIGSFIGDHSKSGLGALLNTGSTIGVCANLLPNGSLLPQVVPSFCQVHYGQLQERWDLRQVFSTAAMVMHRRGQELTETHRDFFYWLYDYLADRRRKTIHDAEIRRLRRSV